MEVKLLPAYAQKIEFNGHKSLPRSYIGYSGLGGECKRAIWYSFRWVKMSEHSARIDRLFKRGKYEESVVEKELKEVGCIIHSQEMAVIGIQHHVMGHIDGIVENLPGCERSVYLLEIKTMNDSNFKKFKKVGLKIFSPSYWQQIHSYMAHLELKKCLYIVTNKNNEERDYQKIPCDETQFAEGERLALDILCSELPPEKIGNRIFHVCKMCNYSVICHQKGSLLQNCRTCEHSDIVDEGWECSLQSKLLSLKEQEEGCDQYNRNPAFD